MKKTWFLFILLLLWTQPATAWQKPPAGTLIKSGHLGTRELAGYWLLNEGAGSRTQDISGNKNHGTINGPTWGPGKDGYELDFVTANPDNIIIPKESELITGTHDWTLSTWIKPATNPAVSCIGLQWRRTSADNDYLMVGVAALMRVAVYHPGEVKLVTDVANAIDVGVWQQFAITRNGDNYILYKNGLQISTGNPAGIDFGSGAPFSDYYIGSSSTDIQGFDGLHNGTIIYSRCLSAAEIMQLYTNPYAMLQQQQVWQWFVAAPGVKIPVFYHHYKQMGN